MSHAILIAGIGNIFLGDDGFGVEVAQRMMRRQLPEGVTVADFGIRGFDLAFTLAGAWDAVILVDAIERDAEPGTLFLVERDQAERASAAHRLLDPHGMNPTRVFEMVDSMGGKEPDALLILGCQPDPTSLSSERIGLSAAVEQAVDEAVRMIEEVVAKLLRGLPARTMEGRESPRVFAPTRTRDEEV